MKKSEASIEGPVLRFVTLAGDPSHAAKDDTIRKLVKSNASRSRKALAGHQGSPNHTYYSPVPELHSGLVSGKSRFALSSRKPVKRVRRQAMSCSGGTFKGEHLQLGSTASVLGETVVNSLANLNVSINAHQLSYGSPQYSPASLPVITKSIIQTMAQNYFSKIIEMQGLFYDIVGLAALARSDDAIFHGSMSITSLYYDTGANDLFHCQQTLSHVSHRLSNRDLRTSDETIGAVGLLVIHNILSGTRKHSALHMNGLQQMVCARDGLDKLPMRLRRTLSMIDLFHATTWDCSPRFPFIRPQENFSTAFSALPSLSRNDLQFLEAYGKSCSEWSMHGMLQVLRILTAVIFSDPLAGFNQMALSDAIYLLEYQLLLPQPCLEPELVNATGLQEAFRLAVFLYIAKVLRKMSRHNIKGLVNRLIGALKPISPSRHAEASVRPRLDILLWMIMIGRVNAYDVEDMEYLSKELIIMCGYLNFEERIDFHRYLDKVGPVLQPFKQQCEEILSQIEEFNGFQ